MKEKIDLDNPVDFPTYLNNDSPTVLYYIPKSASVEYVNFSTYPPIIQPKPIFKGTNSTQDEQSNK